MTGNRKVLAATATSYIATEFERRKTELGESVRSIASTSGLGTSTVQRALKGVSDLSVESYLAMCGALHIDPIDLIMRAEDSARQDL